MNKAAGDDELAARRKENAAKERAVELARQIEAQQDRLRKYATETRVLDAYREIAQEIGLFGQGIEEIYVGKFNGKPFLFDPFIPNNALVFTKSAVDDSEIVHVGYDVAKALITKQPPNAIAIAFPSMEAMVHHFGERCWRCAGTGNISRNWTVMDQLCDQCNKTGWIKK
jgi:ASC-1-like (ASCH) protein